MADAKLTCLDCGQINKVPTVRLDANPRCGVCGAKLMPTKPVEVDLKTLEKAAKKDDVPLIVDFWAPWCGPCKMMGPEFSKAANALSGRVRLVKLNTEDHQSAGMKYQIRGIPTMVKFEKGREVKRQSGAMAAPQIIGWING